MSRGFSIYLDLFRLIAALVVVVTHAHLPQMGGDWLRFDFGAEAVAGFFVLSGFVIAHVAATKEREPQAYAAARLSRLWSILLPALAITPLLDAFGGQFSLRPYEGWGAYMAFDNPLLRLSTAALFLNQIWFLSVAPLSNMPVWSLGYEAWYYAIFGIYLFARGPWRAGFLVLFAAIAGPSILLLAPAWIFGVWLYNKRHAIVLSRHVAITLFVGAPLLILAGRAVHLQPLTVQLQIAWLGKDFVDAITFADAFIWQNLVGTLICLHLAGALCLTRNLAPLPKTVERSVRTCARFSYPIYLFHFPMQLVIAAMLHARPDGLAKTAMVVGGSLAFSVSMAKLLDPVHAKLRAFFLWGASRLPTKSLKTAKS